MLENQTPELFQDVNKPKYNGTLNLDRWAISPSIEFYICLQCVLVPAGLEGLGRGRWPSGLHCGGYRHESCQRLTYASPGQPGKLVQSWTTLWPSPL